MAFGLIMIYFKTGKILTGIEELKGLMSIPKNAVGGVNI
jgi:hypothetical protein